MKRRDFLKLLGVAVVAPGSVVAAVKAGPKLPSKIHSGKGITNEQLRDLIQTTLKDLPKGMWTETFAESHKRQEKFYRAFIGQYYDQTSN